VLCVLISGVWSINLYSSEGCSITKGIRYKNGSKMRRSQKDDFKVNQTFMYSSIALFCATRATPKFCEVQLNRIAV